MRAFIWLLCAALFALRVGDAHIHLCMDGSEPPVSIHLADDRLDHHSDSAQIQHHDQDFSFSDGFLKYSAKVVLATVESFVLLLCIAHRVLFRQPRATIFFIASAPPFFLRPPLRGPPV
jgi:hypothetical protein